MSRIILAFRCFFNILFSGALSETALTTSIEWNYKVVSSHDVRGFGQIRRAFQTLFTSFATFFTELLTGCSVAAIIFTRFRVAY